MSDRDFPKLGSYEATANTRDAMHSYARDSSNYLQDFWTRLLAAGQQHMLAKVPKE